MNFISNFVVTPFQRSCMMLVGATRHIYNMHPFKIIQIENGIDERLNKKKEIYIMYSWNSVIILHSNKFYKGKQCILLKNCECLKNLYHHHYFCLYT